MKELATMLSTLSIEQIEIIRKMIKDLNAHDQKLKPKSKE